MTQNTQKQLLEAAADVTQWFKAREQYSEQGARLIANLQAAIDAIEVTNENA
tara:strand:- start:3483 stop:3638 length:156 start_codon:yes stop_codon:yes gene_type:complete